MEFFRQYGLLFSNMEWFVIVCLILGLVLLLIEMFQPGFGFFGISGFIMLGLCVVLRAVFHKENDNVLMQVFQLLLFLLVIIGSAFGIFLVANHKKWLKRTPFMQEETAVDPVFSDGTENFAFLLGKCGESLTSLRPSGKAVIEGGTYDVVAENFFLEKGTKIKVSKVEGAIISVVENKDTEID